MCEPALPENTSERSVFIPDGIWINAFTGEEVVGPKTITVTGGLDVTPIFIRKGSAILTSEVVSPMNGADWQELSVNFYGLSETTVNLYEDDGETTDYLDGKVRTTEIAVTSVGDAWQIDIGEADGDFDTEYSVRTVKLRFHSETPVSVTANGAVIPATLIKEDAQALPFANSGASNISDVYEVTVEVDLAKGMTLLISDEEEDGMRGDINLDGRVTLLDALMLLDSLLENKVEASCDVNRDGKINLIDVLRVLKTVVKN